MFRINEHGTHAALWQPPSATKPGYYTVHDVLTQTVVARLLEPARILDISWPWITAATGSEVVFYRVCHGRCVVLRRVLMVADGLVFIQPQRVFVVWAARQTTAHWWGVWVITNDTVHCEQSGMTQGCIAGVMPGFIEYKAGGGDQIYYYDMTHQTSTAVPPPEAGFVPLNSMWGTGSASAGLTFQRGPHLRVQWKPKAILITLADQQYKYEGTVGTGLSSNFKWIVTATQTDGRVILKRFKMPAPDPCGTYKALQARLVQDSAFLRDYTLLKTLLPVSTFVLDDLFLLW